MTDNLEDSNFNMKNIYASPKNFNLKFDLFEKNDVICEDYNENLLENENEIKKSFFSKIESFVDKSEKFIDETNNRKSVTEHNIIEMIKEVNNEEETSPKKILSKSSHELFPICDEFEKNNENNFKSKRRFSTKIVEDDEIKEVDEKKNDEDYI